MNPLSYYRRLIEKFPGRKVFVVGDLMVDRFVRGKVSRISPEAPVPVVKVSEETDVPGGAGNVIMNLAALGANVSCCGLIGSDAAGDALLESFARLGADSRGIFRDASRPTILKTRVIAEHQQVVRFDQESDPVISHETQAAILGFLPEQIRASDAVVLSDYGKGVISRATLRRAIAFARKYGKPVCVDPKVEHFQLYRGVTCVTPNLSEAMGGMRKVRLEEPEGVKKLGLQILAKLKCASVLITQGEEGMTLFEPGRETHIPAQAQEVFDVTGAGDTVISVLSLCLASGAGLVKSAVLSNLAAGIVVGKLGTATVGPAELKAALGRLSPR